MVDYEVVDTLAVHTLEPGDMVRIGDLDYTVEDVVDYGDSVSLELRDDESDLIEVMLPADDTIELLGIAHTEDD